MGLAHMKMYLLLLSSFCIVLDIYVIYRFYSALNEMGSSRILPTL